MAGEVLQRRQKLSRNTNFDGYHSTSLWPAVFELASGLQSGGWPATTVSKYLALRKIAIANAKYEVDYELANATLSLHIPGAPDYRPALSMVRRRFHGLSDSDARDKLPSSTAYRAKFYFGLRRLEELLKESQSNDLDWVVALRKRLFTNAELVAFRDMWRRMLSAFGLKDAEGDLETVVTWAPDCYWIRAREEERHRRASAG